MSISNASPAPLRVGFVGAGRMAREHILAFSDIEGVVPVGIASRTASRAKELADELGVTACYPSLSAMCTDAKLDLLVVSVPETETVAVLREGMASGVPILTEKPIGLHLADCSLVHRLAKKNGAMVWVGLNRRCYGATRAAVADLSENAGQRLIEIRDQQDMAVAREVGWPEIIVKNWMYANSIHLVDYLHVFGRGEVEAVENILPWTPESPGIVVSKIHFSSGDIGFYHAVWGMPGPWSCEVTTPTRRWEMRPLEQARSQGIESRAITEAPADPWDTAFKAGFRLQAQEVVDALRNNTAPPTVPNLDQALATTKLIAQIYGPGIAA